MNVIEGWLRSWKVMVCLQLLNLYMSGLSFSIWYSQFYESTGFWKCNSCFDPFIGKDGLILCIQCPYEGYGSVVATGFWLFFMRCWLMLDGMELLYFSIYWSRYPACLWCHYMVMFGCVLVDSLAIFHVFKVLWCH